VAGEVIATPGSESNVKEIFDKCWELRQSGQSLCIFNQFDEMGNYLWHHEITGPAILEVLYQAMGADDCFQGLISATGSGGTLACGDFLKKRFPRSRIAAAEALQCPTLLNNGFGAHRIEGIGDKHVPWIHNVKNTDVVVAIDDAIPIGLIRLFNEPAGRELLAGEGVPRELIDQLDLVGISGAGNLAAAIKFAKYFELGRNDVLVTILTDSMDLYRSRLRELKAQQGEFGPREAAVTYENRLRGLSVDYLEELTYTGRKRIHHLKYFTWVEQQAKRVEDLQAQWYDRHYWDSIVERTEAIDELIEAFNERTGLLNKMS